MTLESVWAVFTSYRPDAGLLTAIMSVRAQVQGIVVVDDGSGPTATSVLDAVHADGAIVIRSPENAGIANALNVGIEAAIAAGADAVVAFDQDSHAQTGFVDALKAARARARATGISPGPVVPEFFDRVRQSYATDENGNLLARRVIQSGMLLDAETLRTVGLMDERLFIDLVDIEYELRSLTAGRPAVAAPGVRLDHALGRHYAVRGLRIPGIPRVMMLSTPFRYYYRARNRVMIDARYARRHPSRIVRDALQDYVYFAVVWSLARPRRAMWRLVSTGIRDGRRGHGGRMPTALETVAASIRWAADPLPPTE